jgi:hypothetical protein
MDKVQKKEISNTTLSSSTFKEECVGMYGRIM